MDWVGNDKTDKDNVSGISEDNLIQDTKDLQNKHKHGGRLSGYHLPKNVNFNLEEMCSNVLQDDNIRRYVSKCLEENGLNDLMVFFCVSYFDKKNRLTSKKI